ncbi:hypothetical protein [Shewanella sedimentimangrovi]|uniref:Uncharacterized protein n=1 Tax=Shewanella sedimentimangrovi TaxID=2814293 RepID=A0ABX7QXH9_9GAMM|nr:hypothetical protein [Shewanella sedimentimangrovi]QSX36222.1 hypothetical protein JYB85_12895 [Shewanella sedimentimangrovi]
MTRLFLLPLLLCLLWSMFLYFRRIPLAEGKQGYVYILSGSGILIALLSLLLWLTH